jgi:carboxyl-terminal processing protease
MDAKRPARPAGIGWRVALALASVAALTSCGDHSGPLSTFDRTNTHALFREGYQQIAHYYIEPTDAERLAQAGLAKLSTLDPSITVQRQGGEILVLQNGSVVDHFAAPAPTDNDGWGAVTASTLERVRTASSKIAADNEDDVDKVVFDGAVGTLDRFSHYASPEAARELRAERSGFGGIGVTLDSSDEAQIRILSVIPDSPAGHAGLKADDRILTVDGAAASTLSREQVVARLRGEPGTPVILGIARKDTPGTITFSIARAHIVLPTVDMKRDGKIITLRISSFNEETSERLIDAIKKARRDIGSAPSGIILDLRDNPGGLLDQSVDVLDAFLDNGVATSTLGRLPESRKSYEVDPMHLSEGVPMVVLINGGSASASEIVASTLQDSGRAVVIGTSSYGKGTVQTVLDLMNEGELTVTWAKLITPEGYVLHEHGVVPTVCTAGISGDQASVQQAVMHGTTAGSGPAARPRAALDEQGWRQLRDACPAERVDRDADVKIAEELLRDPALYERALGALPTLLAHNTAAAR